MRHLFIILPLFLFGISGCALMEAQEQPDEEPETKRAVEGFDTPLAVNLDSSMVGWYESLASINYVAVIPARSDIEVGEIYLTWDEKKAENAHDRLQRMMQRQRWESSIVPDKVAIAHQDLDYVGLPFVAMSTKDSRTLSAVVPSNISSKKGSVSLRPTAGRVESQPLHDILNWLEADHSDDIGAITIKRKYWSNLSAMSVDSKQPVWLYVVSEILYMQSLDIKLSGELNLDLPENVGAEVRTDLPTTEDDDEEEEEEEKDNDKDDSDNDKKEASAKEDNKNEQATVQVSGEDNSAITLTQDTNAFTRALAINEVMEAQGIDNNFGVTTKLMFIDEYGVVLRQTLPRPVAIGVRGLALQVNPLNGEVLKIQSWQP